MNKKTLFVKWQCVYVSKVEVEVDENGDIVHNRNDIAMEIDIPENQSSQYECDTLDIISCYEDEDCENEISL